jgi:RNA-directed DNA polymerase
MSPNLIIKKKTTCKRLNRYLKMTWNWCKENRHDPIQDLYQALSAKLRGLYQYYGVRSNFKALEAAYEYTGRRGGAG